MFWAYTHNADGDLIHDFGDFESLDDALKATTSYMHLDPFALKNRVLRVVDADGNTCWIAGPVTSATRLGRRYLGRIERTIP